jgi:hypothetical protein
MNIILNCMKATVWVYRETTATEEKREAKLNGITPGYS